MGYQRPPLKLTFEDPQYEGLEIRMKRLPLGDMFDVAELSDLGDGIAQQKEQLDKLLTSLSEGIISWNLEDESGTPVPAEKGRPKHRPEPGCCGLWPAGEDIGRVVLVEHPNTGLYAQDVSLIMDVVAAWLEAVAGVSRPLAGGSTSGQPSPEEFDLTEVLSQSR